MSHDPERRPMPGRIAIWLGIGALVLLLGVANAHLVYVAMVSQPDCVAHMRPGDAATARGRFAAAASACSSD